MQLLRRGREQQEFTRIYHLILRLVTIVAECVQFVPNQTVKQWKLGQRASTCANFLTMTSLRIKR